MILKHIKSQVDTMDRHQDIECLQIKQLTVCFEQTNLGAVTPHLVYGDDHFEDELRQMGQTVTVTEMEVPLKDEDAYDLFFTHFEAENCDIYLFKNFAVRANENCHIEVFCKENITLSDAAARWGAIITRDTLTYAVEVQIPNDKFGKRAVELEQIIYRVWDILRAPGEIYSTDERIEWIEEMSKSLVQDPLAEKNYFSHMFQFVSEEIETLCEDSSTTSEGCQDYYSNMIQDLKDVQQTLEALQKKGWNA